MTTNNYSTSVKINVNGMTTKTEVILPEVTLASAKGYKWVTVSHEEFIGLFFLPCAKVCYSLGSINVVIDKRIYISPDVNYAINNMRSCGADSWESALARYNVAVPGFNDCHAYTYTK